MLRSHKDEFQKWAVGKTYILNELEGCPLKAGDKVTVVNSYGVEIHHREVMGIESPEHTKKVFPSCKETRVYLDWDCYWFSKEISSITKE